MARTISFQQALSANQNVDQQSGVNNSEFNPLASTSKVSLYAAATVVGTGGRGAMVSLKLGADIQASDIVCPVASAVSTRDHLVASGIGLRGQKITVPIRNEGTATPTVNGYVVIEPLGR